MDATARPFDLPARDRRAADPGARPPRTPGSADRLVAVLERAVDAAGTPVMGIATAGPDGTVAVGPVEGHPLDRLLFLEAAPEWAGVGVAATGRAVEVGSATGTVPVAVAVAVDRGGTVRARLRPRGADTPDAGRDTGVGVEGLIVDACRRVLGLPTPAPTVAVAVVLHLVWLDALVRAAGTLDRPRTWPDATDLHPMAGVDRSARAALRAAAAGGSTSQVAAASVLLRRADALGWARWRRHPSTDVVLGRALRAAEAAWFDDGMFSRWLPSLLPERDDLGEAVRSCYPASLAEPVAASGAALDAASRDC